MQILVSECVYFAVGSPVAQCIHVVFGAVMSDAAMLDAVLELDVWGKERVEGGRRG